MKLKNLLFPAIILIFFSCKKTTDTPTPSRQDTYVNADAGSTWHYHQADSSGNTPVNTDYTITSTTKDSSISGKTYHVYNVSNGNNQYLNISGNDYYQYDSLPAGLGTTAFERLYLKDNMNVGTGWSQTLSVTVPGIPIPVPVTLNYQIAEKGVSRTVNSQNYSDVIHVTATISSTLIPSADLTTSINSYYAKKYGLIENSTLVSLNYLGVVANVNVQTKIVSASLL
ncbi:hypothetical protein FW778_16420 [Ginsengibacter hankyongi]|uniref:Uncharacterized protein n=1 Tax=Ginsengibacter hankyongi TaxID=2607284 RepID=A0A5J5IE43_9BACT|nr:hypothetical protein [Ginsengibacter hankyongi]KAA9037678.1 hypothetical protein FW778_16420 [Ginsengibacter hankyongi]